MARKNTTTITNAEYVAAITRHYAGYTTEELTNEIANRQQALDAGFLSTRERKEFSARINQMTMVLAAR